MRCIIVISTSLLMDCQCMFRSWYGQQTVLQSLSMRMPENAWVLRFIPLTSCFAVPSCSISNCSALCLTSFASHSQRNTAIPYVQYRMCINDVCNSTTLLQQMRMYPDSPWVIRQPSMSVGIECTMYVCMYLHDMLELGNEDHVCGALQRKPAVLWLKLAVSSNCHS
jgi:hypothetical protein